MMRFAFIFLLICFILQNQHIHAHMAGFNDIRVHVVKSIRRLVKGCQSIVPDVMEYRKIMKQRKDKGELALTYNEFLFKNQAKTDFFKGAKMLFLLCVWPEVLFYLNVLGPLLSPNNPWVWKEYPSAFDRDPVDTASKNEIMSKRRLLTVLTSLQTLAKESAENLTPESGAERISQLSTISEMISKPNVEAAISVIKPWIQTDFSQAKKLALNLKIVPGNVIRESILSFGLDGVPNIPIIRRLNVFDLSSQISKITESDKFLQSKGIYSLKKDELEKACFERCIVSAPSKMSEGDMKKQLSLWLRMVKDDPTELRAKPRGKDKVVNRSNLRLAMMGYYTAKQAKSTKEFDAWRRLFV